MSTLTSDTHDFVKTLKGAGFSEEQAGSPDRLTESHCVKYA
jgi:hypothetical protein